MPSPSARRRQAALHEPCHSKTCGHDAGDHRPTNGGTYCYACQATCPPPRQEGPMKTKLAPARDTRRDRTFNTSGGGSGPPRPAPR